MEKSCRKYAPNASPIPPFLVKSPKQQEILLKVRYLERGLSKTFKKVNLTFFFPTQSLSVDKIIKNKRGLELGTSHSSGYKTNPNKFLF